MRRSDTDPRALAIPHEWVKTTGAEMNEARLRMTLDEAAPKLKIGVRMLSEIVRADAREGDIGMQPGEIAKANPGVTIGSYPFFDPQHGPNTNVVLCHLCLGPLTLAAHKLFSRLAFTGRRLSLVSYPLATPLMRLRWPLTHAVFRNMRAVITGTVAARIEVSFDCPPPNGVATASSLKTTHGP
jgi:hypothetical protein